MGKLAKLYKFSTAPELELEELLELDELELELDELLELEEELDEGPTFGLLEPPPQAYKKRTQIIKANLNLNIVNYLFVIKGLLPGAPFYPGRQSTPSL
jgi:hypothetical protein